MSDAAGTIPVAELPQGLMAIRYDNTVHAIRCEGTVIECGRADIPAMQPEFTGDPVDCMWCVSIVG